MAKNKKTVEEIVKEETILKLQMLLIFLLKRLLQKVQTLNLLKMKQIQQEKRMKVMKQKVRMK